LPPIGPTIEVVPLKIAAIFLAWHGFHWHGIVPFPQAGLPEKFSSHPAEIK
jgi:hypothetical protein